MAAFNRVIPSGSMLLKYCIANGSASTKVLFVTVLAIWSPTITVRADVLSADRTIVNVSVDIAVTVTISEFVGPGTVFIGQIVALNGTAGNRVPVPAVTTKDVPDAAGLGAVDTKLYAKFLCASANQIRLQTKITPK